MHQRILVWRLFGLVYSALILLKGFGILSTPKTPTYYVYLLFLTILMGCGLFGGYRVTKANVERWTQGRGDPWLPLGFGLAFIMPFVAYGIFLIFYQHTAANRFERQKVFHGKTVNRDHAGQKLILCLGGSSTEGSPFRHDWPFDYPGHLERILLKMKLDVVVANAGIIATTSQFAFEHMPDVLEALHPDVVTINYMNNDGSGSLAEALFYLLKQIGFSHFEKRFENYRSQHIRNLVRLVKKHGAECVLILEPHFNDIYFGRDPFPKIRRLIQEIAVQEGAVVVDPNPVFKIEKDRLIFVDSNVHLTRFGTELLAELLAHPIRDLFAEPKHVDTLHSSQPPPI